MRKAYTVYIILGRSNVQTNDFFIQGKFLMCSVSFCLTAKFVRIENVYLPTYHISLCCPDKVYLDLHHFAGIVLRGPM